MRLLFSLIGLTFLLCFSTLTMAAGRVTQVHVSSDSHGNTKAIFELSGDVNYHHFFLVNPARLVIDFEKTKFTASLSKVSVTGTAITKIRSGHPEDAVLRLVIELAYPVTTNAKVISDSHGKRLEFDLIPKDPKAAASRKVAKIPTLNPTNREVVVVIDAGHGGKDSGAIGNYGTQEKDIVLAIAKELQILINHQPGMRAVMTRTGNYYITLRQRLDIARRAKADVFVAIHADAFQDTHSSGASVYALSLKGASSEAARWLAEKENYSELGGVKLGGKDDMLRSVLIDLSQTATISSSLALGRYVLNQLGHYGHLHRGHIEQARFVVLKSPDIPSILVETGFITNPTEEQKLRSAVYQKQLAQAMMQGIRVYFQHNL